MFSHNDKKKMHDSLVTRMLGSDWGDRSNQPISTTMKVYWSVFIVVVSTGIYKEYFSSNNTRDAIEKDLQDQVALRNKMEEFQKLVKKDD